MPQRPGFARHALALWLHSTGSVWDLDPTGPEAAAYLAGEELRGDATGWTLVTAGGLSLGWAKGSGGVLKNHYPKGCGGGILRPPHIALSYWLAYRSA